MGLLDKEWIVVWDESPTTPMADLVCLLCFFLSLYHTTRPMIADGLGLFCDGGGTTPFFLLAEAGHVAKPFGGLEVIEQGLRVYASRKA